MKRWTGWIGPVLLAVAGALIVYLVRQNQRLADRYTALRERSQGALRRLLCAHLPRPGARG